MIQAVSIQGFRYLENVEINLHGATMFAGRNKNGKTTLLNAIRFALFGRCDWTTKGGAGAKELIADGVDAANIALTVTGKSGAALWWSCQISRKNTEVMLTDAASGELLAESRESAWSHLGWDRKSAEAASFPEEFCESDGLGNALVEVLGASMTPIDLASYAEKLGTFEPSFVESITNATAHLSGSLKLTTSAHWKKLGTAAYDKRRDTNTEIKTLTGRIENMVTTEPPVAPDGKPMEVSDTDELFNAISSLKLERDGCVEERAILAQHDDGSLEIDPLLERLQEAKKQHEQASSDLAEKQTKRDELKTEITRLVNSRAVLSLENENGKTQIAAIAETLKKHKPGVCSSCGQNLPTGGADSARAALIDKLDMAKKNIANREKSISKIEKTVSELGVESSYADSDVEQSERAQNEWAETSTEVSAELKRVAKINESLEGLSGLSSDGLTEKITDLEARISKAEENAKALDEYDEYSQCMKRVETLRHNLPILEWIVEHVKGGKFQNACVVTPVEEFIAKCAKSLEPFDVVMGYRTGDKLLELTIDGRPMRDASNGEKLLARYAVAKTFSEYGGLAVLDNCDTLDGDNRSELLAQLSEAGDNATILCATALSGFEEDFNPDRIAETMAPLSVGFVKLGAVEMFRHAK